MGFSFLTEHTRCCSTRFDAVRRHATGRAEHKLAVWTQSETLVVYNNSECAATGWTFLHVGHGVYRVLEEKTIVSII